MNQQQISVESPEWTEFERLLQEDFDATKPGELVQGTVVSVERDYVRVDIGFKMANQKSK